MRFRALWGNPVWSDAFMLGMIALAATPLFEAPVRLPQLSLSEPLGHGLYIGGLGVCILGFFVLRGIENRAALQGMAGLKTQIADVRTEAAQHHAETAEQHRRQLAEQQIQHEAQMAAAEQHSAKQDETHRLVLEIRQQRAEAREAHAPAIKVAALDAAVAVVEAALAEESYSSYSIPQPVIRGQGWVTSIQPFLGYEELPVPMRELQEALRDLEKTPPTDSTTAIATAKQLSSLSQAIPNAPASSAIADHKADIVNFTAPSESSSGAHRPPKASS